MTVSTRLLGVVPLLCMMLSSCAPKRSEVTLNTDAVSATSLVTLVETRARQLHSLVGRGSVTFESPQMAGSAFFTLSVRKPDSLLVQLAGPFGMDLGTLFMSRDRFVMYNSMENRVISGVPTPEAIRSVLPFDISYDELMDAFTGGFGIPREGVTLQQYNVEDGKFHLSYRNGTHTADYWVDPTYLLVTKVRIRNGEDQVVMEASSSSVKQEDQVCAPRRVTVAFPTEHRQLAVSFSALALNTEDVPFDYSIPSNARNTGDLH